MVQIGVEKTLSELPLAEKVALTSGKLLLSVYSEIKIIEPVSLL